MRLGVGTLVFTLAFGSWLACLHHAPAGGAGRVLRVLDHTGRGTTPLPLPLAGREAAPPPFDLDSPSGLRATLTLVASRGGWSSERPGIADIVLLTSDRRGVRLAANTALQLRRFGIAHTLVLMGAEVDCGHAQAEYAWLAAGWSRGLRGFGRYKGTGFSQSDVDLWALWSAKWLVLARLVELRASVLALDTDMLVLADPYPLLRAPPLSRCSLVLPAEGTRVNLGIMYVRGGGRAGMSGVASVLWDVVRRLRLFLEQGDEWLLRDARSGRPSLQGLWDQGLFTDAIQSAILGRHLYPYTYLQSDPRHVAWNRTGGGLEWPAPGQDRAPKAVARLHRVQWRMPREREQGDPACSGSWRRPRWLGDAPAAFRRTWHKAEPLLWGRLHALDPLAGLGPTATSGDGARAVQPGFLTPTDRYPRRGGGETASEDGDGEVAAAAPAWFACSPPHAAVTGGWAEARRGGVACALLHLVELRSQFVAFRSLDTRKANRPYVMGFYGYLPVDESPLSSAPWPPPGEPLRAVRLSEATLRATGTRRGIGSLLNALQLLRAVAAATNRTPVVPAVGCDARWIRTSAGAQFGVADDSVLVRWEADLAAPRCHLAMGGAECSWPHVLPAWWPNAVRALPPSPDRVGAASLRAPVVAEYGTAATAVADPDPATASCNNGSAAELRQGLALALDAPALAPLAAALATAPLVEIQPDYRGAAASVAASCWPSENAAAAAIREKRWRARPPLARGDRRSLAEAPAQRDTAGERARVCTMPASLSLSPGGAEGPAAERREQSLRARCPAFWAARGHDRHDRLDRMHRRRPTVEPCT